MRAQGSLVFGALAMWASIGPAAPDSPQLLVRSDPREVLRALASVTGDEWAAVERGEAVAKLLVTDTREVAVAGAVRIAAPRSRLVARLRDVESLRRSGIVLDVGRFSASPRPADLARVSFEDRSLDLRECRPGSCPVRLSAADIGRFHAAVDWRVPAWRVRSAEVWRDVLAGHTAAYVMAGRRALPVYVNKEEPLSVADELDLLVERYLALSKIAPAFYRYLGDLRPSRLPGAAHLVYWSKEDFSIRPIVRISHQVAVTAAEESLPVLVATNQIYADHYLDAALGIVMAIDVPDVPGDSEFYMVAVNRARTRSLSGWMRKFARSTVQRRSRDGLQKILVATKTAMEKGR